MPKATYGTGSVANDPFGAPGSTLSYQYLPPIWGSVGGDFCSPFLVEQKWNVGNKIEMVEAIQSSSLTHSLHLKVEPSQQGANSSGIPPRGDDSISQLGEAEKTTRGRDSPVVRNLPYYL
jgi:hypothetical protein